MSSKGMTVMSEILLAMTVLGVTVMLALMASGVLGGQISDLFEERHISMAEEVELNIERVNQMDGGSSLEYRPPSDSYSLRVQEGRIQVRTGSGSTTFTPRAQLIETEEISDTEAVCFQKTQDGEVTLTEGGCDAVELDEVCEDGCGPDACYPDLGEDCSDLGCECTGEQLCLEDEPGPEYDPEYIDEDSEISDELNCLNEDYIGVQDSESRCEYDFECQEGLECAKEQGGGESYCCPVGERYNSDTGECEGDSAYNLAFVPARYSSQADFSSDADEFFEYYISRAPFRECSQPDQNVDKIKVETSECEIDNCNVWESNQCFEEMKSCADEHIGVGEWDKIVGLAEGTGPSVEIDGELGIIAGRAESIPGEVSVTYTAHSVVTGAHEIGHTKGLYHVDTGQEAGTHQGPNEADNHEPLEDRMEFIMSYSNQRDRFGPAGYEHIKENVVNEAIEGCTT